MWCYCRNSTSAEANDLGERRCKVETRSPAPALGDVAPQVVMPGLASRRKLHASPLLHLPSEKNLHGFLEGDMATELLMLLSSVKLKFDFD